MTERVRTVIETRPLEDFIKITHQYRLNTALTWFVRVLALVMVVGCLFSLYALVSQSNPNYVPVVIGLVVISALLYLGGGEQLKRRGLDLRDKGQGLMFKAAARAKNWKYLSAQTHFDWQEEDDIARWALPDREYWRYGPAVRGIVSGQSFTFGEFVFATFGGRSGPEATHQRTHYNIRERVSYLRIPLSRDYDVRACHCASSSYLARFESAQRGESVKLDEETPQGTLKAYGRDASLAKRLIEPRVQKPIEDLVALLKASEYRLVINARVRPEDQEGEEEYSAFEDQELLVLIHSDRALAGSVNPVAQTPESLSALIYDHIRAIEACVRSIKL